ncbi:hypothetical protein MMC22_005045 [Lobaria immixta]|nr:hypothetical protein [Lobaria immixta]
MSSFRSLIGQITVSKNDQQTPAEPPRQESRSALSSKEGFPIGLKPLYEPESAVVDIVFVHGLTGGMETTWTAKNAVFSWPQTLLPTKLPHARILTFGYDADVVDLRAMVSKDRIGNHAENLLTALATHRENDDTNCRHVLFVAHSLGGLVCEDVSVYVYFIIEAITEMKDAAQALLASRNSAEKHLQKILPCTRGILFLGTPHGGSGLATWAELLAKSVGLVKQANPQILEVLKSDSEVLARIQKEFHSMVRARANNHDSSIAITCFYEQLPLPGIGEVSTII